MVKITLVRHAQASFGAANYDALSALGKEQARALGAALKLGEHTPTHIFRGRQVRHRETLEGLASELEIDPSATNILPELDEFDAGALLRARFGDSGRPEGMRSDRRLHFKTLRETVLLWQKDEIDHPPEPWQEFLERTRRARKKMQAAGGDVLAVSSGGAISLMLTDAIGAPPATMIQMQLQMQNCAISRLVGNEEKLYFHSFNETLHVRSASEQRLLTYA